MGWFSKRKNKKEKANNDYPETVKYDCIKLFNRSIENYNGLYSKTSEVSAEEYMQKWNQCIATSFLQDVKFSKGEFVALEKDFELDSNPYFVCNMDGKKCFVFVKCEDSSGFFPDLSPLERINAIDKAISKSAEPYYVSIGVSHSYDNGPGYNLHNYYVYINYYGIKKIERKSEEWINGNLEEINRLKPDSSEEVRYSLSIDISDYHDWDRRNTSAVKTFQEQLMFLINDKGLSNNEFYKAAYIDRKLFSAIKNNTYYKPKKQTAVACCFGLKLSIDESEELLKLAGYSFSLAIKWDKIVYYCLKNGIYDINDVNDLLYEEGENCF